MGTHDDDLTSASIVDLARLLGTGATSAVALTEACLARITARDHLTGAVLTLNPDALEAAARSDRDRAADKPAGPLEGLPVLVKDNLDTGDAMPTTAGSLALEGTFATCDATVVARLRAAGAVLLGKTNLSEWANFRSSGSSSGWSSLGGQTRNPHALDRTPGGSSSGSAVAVAAGFSPAAIGTETSGSIVGPSAMNGVVGIKPTVGLVSRHGIVPLAASQDTAGPMARSVADAAIVLEAIAGFDARDPASAGASTGSGAGLGACAGVDGLRGRRLGLGVGYCGFDERVDACLSEAVRAMRDAGAQVVEIELPATALARPHEVEVMVHEFRRDIDTYLAARDERTSVRTLADLVAFNRANAVRVMPYFGQDLLERALDERACDAAVHRAARAASLRIARDEGLDRALREHQLDAVLTPAGGAAWLIDWVNGDNRRATSAGLAAVAGYPNVCVPAGSVHGLPVAVSFAGPAWSEGTLIAIAAGFEHVVGSASSPSFAPTVDFARPAPPCLRAGSGALAGR